MSWLDEHQASMMVLLTLAYVLATGVMVRAMLASNRLSRLALQAAADAEQRRMRPRVFFDIELKNGIVFAVLRSTGASPALNVKATLEPVLYHLPKRRKSESGLTKHSHAFLAPGRVLEDLIDTGPDFFEVYPPGNVFMGHLSYEGVDGVKYSEPLTVDLRVHEDILFTEGKDVGKELSKIGETLKNLAGRIK
jgi:hypothetical protein